MRECFCEGLAWLPWEEGSVGVGWAPDTCGSSGGRNGRLSVRVRLV